MLFMRDCAMYLWGGGSVGLAELFGIPFVLRGQGVWGVCCDNLYLSIFLEKRGHNQLCPGRLYGVVFFPTVYEIRESLYLHRVPMLLI